MKALIANVTCVAIDGRALLIEGDPGSGKTSLALSLIDRGAILVGDDGIALETGDGHPVAFPPPGTAGMIEIRNVGIVGLPTTSAPVALVLQLQDDAPRFPLTIAARELAGIAIPCLPFRAGDAIQALRAEHAMQTFGLTIARSRSSGARSEP